jgi:hypothetical protein
VSPRLPVVIAPRVESLCLHGARSRVTGARARRALTRSHADVRTGREFNADVLAARFGWRAVRSWRCPQSLAEIADFVQDSSGAGERPLVSLVLCVAECSRFQSCEHCH